jgi:nucleotidyltransferase/DNA polymerase involved in DNA repair
MQQRAHVVVQVAAQLRAGVEAATRLTCSVGIAPNATLHISSFCI